MEAQIRQPTPFAWDIASHAFPRFGGQVFLFLFPSFREPHRGGAFSVTVNFARHSIVCGCAAWDAGQRDPRHGWRPREGVARCRGGRHTDGAPGPQGNRWWHGRRRRDRKGERKPEGRGEKGTDDARTLEGQPCSWTARDHLPPIPQVLGNPPLATQGVRSHVSLSVVLIACVGNAWGPPVDKADPWSPP